MPRACCGWTCATRSRADSWCARGTAARPGLPRREAWPGDGPQLEAVDGEAGRAAQRWRIGAQRDAERPPPGDDLGRERQLDLAPPPDDAGRVGGRRGPGRPERPRVAAVDEHLGPLVGNRGVE